MQDVIQTDLTRVTNLLATDGASATVLVIVVLRQGAVGDYAAYRGAVVADKFTSEHQRLVAERGDKLSFDTARSYFGWLEYERYRR